MLVDLAPRWIVILNVGCIPAIHLGISWLFTRLPGAWFRCESALFRERRWEQRGRAYERLFAIRRWKDWLPDGAPWFKGFAKKNFAGRDPEYVRTFLTETCRGEAAHYAQIPGVLLTLAWNPWPVAAGVIILYAVFSNLPCLLVQRYTRLRLTRLQARLSDDAS